MSPVDQCIAYNNAIIFVRMERDTGGQEGVSPESQLLKTIKLFWGPIQESVRTYRLSIARGNVDLLCTPLLQSQVVNCGDHWPGAIRYQPRWVAG